MGRVSITGRPSGRLGLAPIKPQNARKIIRSYHNLLKERTKLIQQGLSTESVDSQLQEQHGIYQQASLSGQSNKRGGDSSKMLVSWLDELQQEPSTTTAVDIKYKCLEIGCLSPDNAISKCKYVDTGSFVRIDLNSQSPEIIKQDFMTMQIPKHEHDKFDLVSCSLVLNFVSAPETRGDMLRRIKAFLKNQPSSLAFLVLPAPCVQNSRYLTNGHLQAVMKAVGFELVREKHTPRISYWLFKVDVTKNGDDRRKSGSSKGSEKQRQFKKTELNPGANRNNFAIVLR